MEGYGYQAVLSSRATIRPMVHQQLAATLDAVVDEIREIQRAAREGGVTERPRWPMIVLRTPKGWTGPEGGRRPARSRAPGARTRCRWARSARTRTTAPSSRRGCARYRPEELFDEDGRAARRARGARPAGTRRMSANPYANGGELLRDLDLPDFRDYAVDVPAPGATIGRGRPASSGRSCATSWPATDETFRIFGPDETASNRLGAVLEVTDRTWMAEIDPGRRSPRARTVG